jgi:Ca-activated chloride channel family protein
MPSTAHPSNGARLVSRTDQLLPLRHVDLACEAFGGIARTTLRQQFSNDHPGPLELTYTFPLPADGAVSGYEIRAGSRVIRGRVQPRETARAQYDMARLQGRTAGLVEQERSNLFTQYLGNIPAATDVIVELTIDQPLRWASGFGWEWRFPTVVAPRYLGSEGKVSDASRVTVDLVNGVTNPTAAVALSIAEDLALAPTSPTHSIVVTNQSVALAADAALDRDIVIRWAVPRQRPGCSIRTMRPAAAQGTAGDTAYGLLTIVPPTAHGEPFPRDLVLLLDVSGSMSGKPLDHLKAVVTSTIETLGDADRIEMIAFSSRPFRFHQEPVAATAPERRKACEWIQSLQAGGGTELIPAIEEALRPLRDGVPRQVIVVTDGLIGFEASAIRAIRDRLPRGSRLHAVGVGSASNRAFLRPAARAGRGVEVLIDLDEPATQGAERVVAATREPVMIDLAIEGTALQAGTPRLPDLLSGSPVIAPLRIRPEGGTLLVRAATPHGHYEERLDVPSPITGHGPCAIATLWAREAIEDLELDLASGGDRKRVDQQIEQIGVEHSVMSRLTSWVAIAEQPSVDPREPVRVERIPQALPYGMNVTGLVCATAPRLLSVTSAAQATAAMEAAPGFSRRRDGFSMPPPGASPGGILKRPARGFEALTRLRSALKDWLAKFSSKRDTMDRLLESQMQYIASLRIEIGGRLSELNAERSGVDAQRERHAEELERLLAEVDARLAAFGAESQQARQSWSSQFDAIDRLRHRIDAVMARLDAIDREPFTEPVVSLRGRVLPAPGRPTVIVEIFATAGFDWRPAGTVTIVDRQVTVVEQGTTRPGPIVVGSVVRLELSPASPHIAPPNTIRIESGDAVLEVALDEADRVD